ncbi:uncharacterized protein DFL_005664 [Arthrobotrys flagrans]|uniref:Uncharacterized protein n=1 Tax=Arthrobotrys flagrans TaxID=97331 RepID=A0A436ZYN5_ARTFL|nr:hypothetical protein DFL_005664 [Arthrobotrys flagrans]
MRTRRRHHSSLYKVNDKMHHGFRHPEAHMETLTMFPTTPASTASSSISITTPTSIPATTPEPRTHQKIPRRWYKGDCFPVEPQARNTKTNAGSQSTTNPS